MQSVVRNTRIAGICTAVPERKVNFFKEKKLFAPNEIKRLFNTTGVAEVRVAPPHMITSDMATAAAGQLMKKLKWKPESIDVLVFVSQGPDMPLPATACLIQQRLGLPNSIAAFDINLGCSGYAYGVWVVSQILSG